MQALGFESYMLVMDFSSIKIEVSDRCRPLQVNDENTACTPHICPAQERNTEFLS